LRRCYLLLLSKDQIERMGGLELDFHFPAIFLDFMFTKVIDEKSCFKSYLMLDFDGVAFAHTSLTVITYFNVRKTSIQREFC